MISKSYDIIWYDIRKFAQNRQTNKQGTGESAPRSWTVSIETVKVVGMGVLLPVTTIASHSFMALLHTQPTEVNLLQWQPETSGWPIMEKFILF